MAAAASPSISRSWPSWRRYCAARRLRPSSAPLLPTCYGLALVVDWIVMPLRWHMTRASPMASPAGTSRIAWSASRSPVAARHFRDDCGRRTWRLIRVIPVRRWREAVAEGRHRIWWDECRQRPRRDRARGSPHHLLWPEAPIDAAHIFVTARGHGGDRPLAPARPGRLHLGELAEEGLASPDRHHRGRDPRGHPARPTWSTSRSARSTRSGRASS